MALHHDIFWVGRQWAVTGAGIQAVDQRLRGVLDIEIARLWDDGLVQSRRAKPGVNTEDFDRALTTARTRFPREPAPVAAEPLPASPAAMEPLPAPPPVPSAFVLRAEGRLARFLPQWRVRR
ncbi:hypothetical protein FXV83_13845 [Bradyrhizobium hipponense]|uniref:Uncharacterized protein n=1 Tax=Bradyrhizobium hipponense TaxID=2605638 RepID=A0A5S4YX17_9BRAD|nr:hypothetical protein [Bradyrhizobium hipponense]TYO66019.1 hypothetical protein FXV83_13845 [Bradyrhizobium hipponense]